MCEIKGFQTNEVFAEKIEWTTVYILVLQAYFLCKKNCLFWFAPSLVLQISIDSSKHFLLLSHGKRVASLICFLNEAKATETSIPTSICWFLTLDSNVFRRVSICNRRYIYSDIVRCDVRRFINAAFNIRRRHSFPNFRNSSAVQMWVISYRLFNNKFSFLLKRSL